jgi:hypothetical protein
VNENGKKEKSSSYTCGTTEDREPTHSGSHPDPSSSIWGSAFYSSGAIHAPKISMKGYFLEYGMAIVETCVVPYFISYSREKG